MARIRQNTKRYVDIFANVIDEVTSTMTSNRPEVDSSESVLEVIINQRKARDQLRANETDRLFPPALTRR